MTASPCGVHFIGQLEVIQRGLLHVQYDLVGVLLAVCQATEHLCSQLHSVSIFQISGYQEQAMHRPVACHGM